MARTKKTNGVWLWELDKFGYTLTAVGKYKTQVIDALMEEYIKTYAFRNGMDEAKCRHSVFAPPILDEDGEVDECNEYNEFRELFRDTFIEFNNGEPEFIEFGKVEWR